MADSNTTNLALVKPEVGASTDTWAGKLNADLDLIDGLYPGGFLSLARGGTAASNAANARTNLGCGTMATQNSIAIAVTGGTVAGVTVDSSAIGATTPSTGKFTDLYVTTSLHFPDGTAQITSAVAFTAGVQSISTSTALALTYQKHVAKADATSGALTVTLFTAVGNTGREVVIVKTDSSANVVTIATTGGQTMSGFSTLAIYRQNDSLSMFSDGTNWIVT